MATLIDSDPRRASSHRQMLDHLTAPLGAGAVETEVPVDSAAKAIVDRTTRFPLLLAAPAAPLQAEHLRLRATLASGPGPATVVELNWAPYTEAGAFLPVWSPDFDPAVPQTAAFTFALELWTRLDGGSETQVATGQVAGRLSLRLVEGIMGQTLYLLGAEKQRLRRAGRELAAMRRLSAARDDAADSLGAELGVPRFADRLKYQGDSIVSETVREPDADYRRRLALYRGTFLRTRSRVLELLNGPGAPTDLNAGPIGQLAATIPAGRRSAYQQRFELVDRNNDFAVAIHIMAAGDPALREHFFDFIRAVHLILPLTSDSSIHAKRFLPAARRSREEALRKSLRTLLDFGSLETGQSPAVAPMLAYALVRAARCITALGGPSPWQVFRTQRDDRGSRYELGIGADLKRLTAAELNAMRTTHATLKGQDPEFNQVTDPDPTDPRAKAELRALLKGMSPQPAAADPQGRWLFDPCGVRTVHPIPRPTGAPWDVSYLSHFPVYGMTISEVPPLPSATIPVGGWTDVAAVQGPGQVEPGRLLSYEAAAGAFELWAWQADGTLGSVKRSTGHRSGWTHLAPGVFSVGQGGVLLYDRTKGEAQLNRFTSQGDLQPLGTIVGGLRKTWTDVLSFEYDRGAQPSRVLFYDRIAGEAAVYTTNGAGALTLLRSHTGLRTSWTLIAALDTWPGFSELLFYDGVAGEAEIWSPGAQGELTLSKSLTGLPKGCSQVATGLFGGDARSGEGFFLYEPVAGEAATYDFEGAPVGRQGGLRHTLSRIVGGQFLSGESGELAAYERGLGKVELWAPAGDGTFTVEGVSTSQPKASSQRVDAHYHAPGDPGANVVLAAGLASAAGGWGATGGTPFTVLSRTQADNLWGQATPRPQTDPALKVFRAAGLPALTDPQPVVTRLRSLPPEMVGTIQLAGSQAAAITGATTAAAVTAAAQDLRSVAGLLKAERLTSLLPLVTSAGDVLLVVGAMPLPVAGINLFEQLSSSFRWYVVPLQGAPAEVRAVGSTTEVVPSGEGLFAVVALGYARRGLTDPYEFRVELPPDALLTLEQYEFLMNLLDHVYPAGVRVNTWTIRQNHVDLKGDGKVYTLDPAISRTYRAFRRRRHRGERSVTLDGE
jgi:hypothetical protein